MFDDGVVGFVEMFDSVVIGGVGDIDGVVEGDVVIICINLLVIMFFCCIVLVF